ncbi:hypothetical protein LLG95_13090 [bacterium]|nr:hypothetical protein [bacterium]
MNFDEMQNLWRSQCEGYKISIDSSVLLGEVKRNHRYFASMILGRDVTECVVALMMTAFFCIVGMSAHFYSLLLVAAASAWVGLFLFIDRMIQKRKHKTGGASLLEVVESSIQDVSHQIWLLEHVLWWYLLPPGVSLAIFYGALLVTVMPLSGSALAFALIVIGGGVLIGTVIFWWVYRLNKAAVRNELLPRKRELEELRESLMQ